MLQTHPFMLFLYASGGPAGFSFLPWTSGIRIAGFSLRGYYIVFARRDQAGFQRESLTRRRKKRKMEET